MVTRAIGSGWVIAYSFGLVRVGFWPWLKSKGQSGSLPTLSGWFRSGFSHDKDLRTSSGRVLVIGNSSGQCRSGFLLLNPHPSPDTWAVTFELFRLFKFYKQCELFKISLLFEKSLLL